jgi:D-alanine-D-alanine ligase
MSVNLPRKVALVYSDVKREYFVTEAQYITEKDARREAKVIATYLEKMNIEPVFIPANTSLASRLTRLKPDMVLNLTGSVKGQDYLASAIPGVLELMEVPYTGAGILGESLVYNKFLVKKLLQQNGVPVPQYQLFINHNDPIDLSLRFPLISKLNEIHGGVEITKDAISDNVNHLRNRLKQLIKTYKQPILVEEFIVGREITAILLEGSNKKIYLAERIFDNPADGEKYIFADFEYQWNCDEANYKKYNDSLLKGYVKRAFEITKMSDYGKFDIRLDNSGRYFFIDSNSNPAFGPKELDCALANILDIYGISFEKILKRLLTNTMRDAKGKKLLPIPN